MKRRYNLRLRTPKEVRRDVAQSADGHSVRIRTYITKVLSRAAEKKIVFTPEVEPREERIETRIFLEPTLKPQIQELARKSNRTPEEWAIEVLKIHDRILK